MAKTRVIRVSDDFAQDIKKIQGEYSKTLKRKIKTTHVTAQLSKRMRKSGEVDFLVRDARRRRRKRGLFG